MFKNNGVKIADRFIEYVFCEQLAKVRVWRFIHFFKNTSNPEIKKIVEYYKNNKTTAFQKIFPYPFAKSYSEDDIEVFNDGESYYVVKNGKKMFLGNGFSREKDVKLYYQRLMIEQDPESPHRYITNSFKPQKNDIVFDIGGAEGNFSLEVVDECKKIYIFECDDTWIRELKKTFSEYGDKVEIVNKFVGNVTNETHITIDDFVKENHLDKDNIFFKIDAEGSEMDIIEGAKNTLNSRNVKLSICTYHKAKDEKKIRNKFMGWKIQHSKGYMFFIYDFNIKFPYIRRGLLRIKK